MYLIIKHPGVHETLTKEIRDHFSSSTSITLKSAGDLVFLGAVIKEALRIFPPFPLGGVRESPGQEIDGVYLPPGVCLTDHFQCSLIC
jgi:cytochrome P450